MSMRFDDSDDVRLRIVPRKGVARGVSRERVPWISFYEDANFPFNSLLISLLTTLYDLSDELAVRMLLSVESIYDYFP